MDALIGGVGVASPVLAAALAFVPLLALGLYRAGARLEDRWTGALAVMFGMRLVAPGSRRLAGRALAAVVLGAAPS